jgi:Co/Zn/Cd efflux system component
MKTKLGISAELFGAALYFTGLISIIPLVLMAGYALIVEDNDWLKRTAVKAVAVVIFFAILSSVVALVGNSTSLLSDIASIFRGTINWSWLNRILSICRTVISLAQALILLLLGFMALKQGDVKLGSVDKVIEKNMQ